MTSATPRPPGVHLDHARSSVYSDIAAPPVISSADHDRGAVHISRRSPRRTKRPVCTPGFWNRHGRRRALPPRPAAAATHEAARSSTGPDTIAFFPRIEYLPRPRRSRFRQARDETPLPHRPFAGAGGAILSPRHRRCRRSSEVEVDDHRRRLVPGHAPLYSRLAVKAVPAALPLPPRRLRRLVTSSAGRRSPPTGFEDARAFTVRRKMPSPPAIWLAAEARRSQWRGWRYRLAHRESTVAEATDAKFMTNASAPSTRRRQARPARGAVGPHFHGGVVDAVGFGSIRSATAWRAPRPCVAIITALRRQRKHALRGGGWRKC